MKKTKETKESTNSFFMEHFGTENEHWNEYAFDCYTEAIKSQLFKGKEEVLISLYSSGIKIAIQGTMNPLEVFESINKEIAQQKYSKEQKLFILKHIEKYLFQSEFDEIDTTQIEGLISSHIEILQSDNDKPNLDHLRDSLNLFVHDELEKLPDILAQLEADKRLSVLCKLLPYVMPKADSVQIKSSKSLWDF